jgi:hypothetical protein
MSTSNSAFESFFQQLMILFGALLMGQVLFGAVSYYLVEQGGMGDQPELAETLRWVVLGVAGVALIGSGYLYRQVIQKELSLDDTEEGRMKVLRKAHLIRYALIEGGSLMAIVSYLVSGEQSFGIVALALVLYFVYNRPKKPYLQDAVEGNWEE